MHKPLHHLPKLLIVAVFVTVGISFCHPFDVTAAHAHEAAGDVALAGDNHFQDTHCQGAAKSNGVINESTVSRAHDARKMIAQLAANNPVVTVQITFQETETISNQSPDPLSQVLESSTILRC